MKQLNAEESFAYEYGRLPDDFPKEYYNYYKQGFKKGEENQKLRDKQWICKHSDCMLRFKGS